MPLVLAHVWTDKMTAISTFALAIFALLALASLRDARRTRHAQLIIDLTRRWDELAYAEQLILVLTPRRLRALVRLVHGGRPSRKAIDEFLRLIRMPSLLETIGVLVLAEEAFTVEIVNQLWGPTIIDLWDRWSPTIEEIRARSDSPLAYDYFRRLAEELRGAGG